MSIKKIILISIVMSVLGCGNKNETAADQEAATDIVEMAVAEAGSQATATEGSVSISSIAPMSMNENVDSQSVTPFSTCLFLTHRSTCSSNQTTVDWGGCTTVGGISLTGAWSEAWSNGFCADGNRPGALTNGNSVTRTTSGQTLQFSSEATIVSDTLAHKTYDQTDIPSTGVTVSMASGVRTVVIHGLHKIMKTKDQKTISDHTITSTGLSIQGLRTAGTRQVSGAMTLFHNLASYKAVHTFSAVTWGQAACCFPTSGSISSQLTGSVSGTTNLTFNAGTDSAKCGEATFQALDGTTSTVTLSQCF